MKVWLPAMAAAGVVLSTMGVARAEDATVYSGNGLDISASAGVMFGMAHEMVYNPDGSKLSELDWASRGDPTMNLGAEWRVNQRLSVYANGTIGLNGANFNDDFDWLSGPPPTPFSDHSWSSDTTLDHYLELDGGLRYVFQKGESGQFSALVGGRYTDVQFSEFGGCYWYNNGGDVGCFPNGELGLSYRQVLPAAYIGVGWSQQGEKWSAGLDVMGGVSFGMWDQDHHWLRDLIFNDFGNSAPFIGAKANVAYALNERSNLFLKASYEKYFEGQGQTDMYAISDGSYQGSIYGNAAGLSWEAINISAGMTVKF
ncbi:MAG: omptin family outer membrane protease [Alphaproteobacteria bacterium]|nr:omptin family outer membrane protease [Alphaproteobacteria bacterium]